jgi:stress response protein SCP2
MGFNLTKIETGERFTLAKSLGLDEIRVELTWNDGDLDTQAWLLNADGVIINNAAFVFYNSENRTEAFDRVKHGNKANYLKATRPMSADGAVLGAKDELKGGIETINITLSKIDPSVEEVVISASCYGGISFGSVQNAKITVIEEVDEDTKNPLCCYELNSEYQTEDACVVSRFVINNTGDWEFEAVGSGYNGGLQTLVDMYT